MPELDETLLSTLDPDRVRQGQALYRAGAVTELRRGHVDELLVLAGRVAGRAGNTSRPYLGVANGRLSGDCSCARKSDCEHVAALLLAAIHGLPEETAPAAGLVAGAPALGHHLAYLLRLSADGVSLEVGPVRVSLTAAADEPVTSPYALARLSDSTQPDYLTAADLGILRAMADHADPTDARTWHRLEPSAHELLGAMVDSGRCHWQRADGPVLQTAPARAVSAEWQLLPSGDQLLRLAVEEDPDVELLPLVPPWRIDTRNGQCARLTTEIDDALLAEWLRAGPLSPEQIDAVRSRLADAPGAFPRPQVLPRRYSDAAPQALLQLVNLVVKGERGSTTVPAAHLRFAYGPVELDWDATDDSRIVVLQGTARDCVMTVQRDSAFEQACCERLEQAGLIPARSARLQNLLPGQNGLWVVPGSADLEQTWVAFQTRLARWERSGWRVERAEGLVLELIEPEDWYGDLRPDVRADDGFELDLGVEYRGQRRSLLPALLGWLETVTEPTLRLLLSTEVPEGWIILALDKRQVVRMPMERLTATLRGLVDCLDAVPRLSEGRLRLPRARLAELTEAAGSWRLGGEQGLTNLTRRLAAFERIAPVAAPDGLHASLREFQAHGLAWLQFLREFGFGGILADDMGLGKTIQALAHMLVEKQAGRLDRPCLVVAPTSLVYNWRAEARRFAPGLKVLALHGPQRKGLFQWVEDSDLVLTTYPLLLRDIDRLGKYEYHLLILDEAQTIKNARAQASRHVRQLQARHRLCLSGTPLENHLGELWSLFDFLMPGFLGSRARFQRLFQRPIERHEDRARREMLIRRIRPFFLRRTKQQVAPELPPKTEIIRAVALEGDQRRLYERVRVALHDKVRRALETQGAERSRIVVLDALLKLRQICCDPRLLKTAEGPPVSTSAKLSLLMDMLPELVAEGRRVLVFSQFVGMLELIEVELARRGMEYTRLTGRTRNRQQVIDSFQAGQVPVFLISLKAGGVGLNLTTADTVIHYDPWWNPAVEDQATDRAYRIGQEQKVFVYKLLAEETIEQRVFELQQSKRGLIEGLLGGGGAVALNPDDLEALFAPLA